MSKIYTEENGIYCIDCTRAVWSSDRMHEDYQKSGIHISDVDFLIEDDRYLYLVEYKNACVPGAANPEAFNPEDTRFVRLIVFPASRHDIYTRK